MEKKLRLYFSLAAFIVPLIVYLITVAPGVGFTDAGELAAVCTTLGIAHPTGYPLFTVLGHLWVLLPWPFEPVFALNIFAAALTAASVVFFFNSVYEIFNYLNISAAKQKKLTELPMALGALASALMYAFALTVWEQAVAVEVYSMQLLLVNAILFVFLKAMFSSGKKTQLLFLAAFLIGLGFSNHMQTILLLPAILLLFFRQPGESFDFSKDKWKLLAFLLVPLLLGLSFYLYLPLRSAAGPEFNWGWVHRGLDKFLYHVQGKQYQVWMFADSSVLGENFGKFISGMPFEMAWIGIAFFLYGMVALFRRANALFWFMLLLIAACLAYALNYSIHDIQTYFLIAYIAALFFASAGIFALLQEKPKVAPGFFALPLLALIMNFQSADRSDDRLVDEYTRILAENLEKDAIIISAQWDYWCSAFWYKQKVEGLRPDVVLIEKELLRRTWYPLQLKRWYPELTAKCSNEFDAFMRDLELFESDEQYSPQSIQANFIAMLNCFIAKNIGERPVYMTMDVMQTDPDIGRNYVKVPQGFAFRLLQTNRPLEVNAKDINIDEFARSLEGREGHLVEGIRSAAALNLANLGRYAMTTGQKQAAIEAFNKTLRLDPKNRYALQGLMQLNKGK